MSCHTAGEAAPFRIDELFGSLSCEYLVFLGLFSFELSFSISVCRIPYHPVSCLCCKSPPALPSDGMCSLVVFMNASVGFFFFNLSIFFFLGFPGAQLVKNPDIKRETWV